MRISRLFEIVYLLLMKKSATASGLAERFEVSKRLCPLAGLGEAQGLLSHIASLNKFVL